VSDPAPGSRDVEFTRDELETINAARRTIDFHLPYREFMHDIVMNAVDDILNGSQSIPWLRITLNPNLPAGHFELRDPSGRVVGSVVSVGTRGNACSTMPDGGEHA
jgi:hypothetical protein